MIKLRRAKRVPRTPDARMPMLDHLGELRNRIIVSFVAVLIGATIAFVFSNDVIEFLVTFYQRALGNDHAKLVNLSPVDGFVIRLKVATYGGIVLALPVWLYELWRFITPALDPREKRYAIPFVASAIVLFAIGAFVAFLTLEPALKFLIQVGGPAQQAAYTSDKYLSLIALMIVAFGLSFEFPIVLVFLLIAHIITTVQLRHARRWAAVGIVDVRRRHHPEPGPLLPVLHGGPDVPVLRGVDHHR